MSIYFSGTFRRSGGIVSAIGKQLKQVNLKAVDRVTVTFDPFNEKVESTREFLFHLTTPKISETNPKCTIKSEVVCDRQPSSIVFKLSSLAQEQAKVKEIKFLSDNLNTLELLQLLNRNISVLVPKEEPTAVLQTKSAKSTGGKGGKSLGKRK